ncbi:MAG TPA: hypothetical protein VD816_04180 [Ohtaekwangia sp.]|nr:hypothetical protein [Ohtaekwangia sp.]
MIGLVLLYFVGKAFYDLANRNNRNKWLFAILGIGAYYAGLVVGGVMIGIGYEIFLEDGIDNANEMLLGFMALPMGVLVCWGYYRLLKSRWERKATFSRLSDDVLDANQIGNNPNNIQ